MVFSKCGCVALRSTPTVVFEEHRTPLIGITLKCLGKLIVIDTISHLPTVSNTVRCNTNNYSFMHSNSSAKNNQKDKKYQQTKKKIIGMRCNTINIIKNQKDRKYQQTKKNSSDNRKTALTLLTK